MLTPCPACLRGQSVVGQRHAGTGPHLRFGKQGAGFAPDDRDYVAGRRLTLSEEKRGRA